MATTIPLAAEKTDDAIAFIETYRKEPFFVYIPHTMPHTRLGVSKAFCGKSTRGLYGDVTEEIDHETGRVTDAPANNVPNCPTETSARRGEEQR